MQAGLPPKPHFETKEMKGNTMKEIYIIIPALCPKPQLLKYVKELRTAIRGTVVLVDDGSGPEYAWIFRQATSMANCVVLTHEKNRGKGCALKTGFAYVRQKEGNACLILCADCDGQHTVGDMIRISGIAKKYPGVLVLGGRKFSGPGIPWRSVFGNRMSSLVFFLARGVWLTDTQTGLRAFDGTLLDFFIQVPGERFEYEMEMLSACAEKGIPVRTEKIRTIYVDENEGSHFRPVRDSFRVMAVLFGAFFPFLISSCLCAVLDVALFLLFSYGGAEFGPQTIVIWVATASARILSATTNYFINKYCVFGCGVKWQPGVRYVMLCAGIAAASAASVSWLSSVTSGNPAKIKIWCDVGLFFVSYWLQKQWVFTGRKAEVYES